LSLVIASAVSGQIISRTGKYKLPAIIGNAITVMALFLFSTINEHTTNNLLIMRMILLGLGLGSTMPIFTLAVQSTFGKERLGEVTAGSQLFRSVGGTVGTAILGGIMNSRLSSEINRLQDEPFVAQMKQMNGNREIEGSMIQGVLNHDSQLGLRQTLEHLPPPARSTALNNFEHFIASSKVAF